MAIWIYRIKKPCTEPYNIQKSEEIMTTVYAAKKDDPIKDGAVDGMEELMEGDDGFEYEPFDPEKTIDDYVGELSSLSDDSK
jgi:hypothetical protein